MDIEEAHSALYLFGPIKVKVVAIEDNMGLPLARKDLVTRLKNQLEFFGLD